MESSFKRILLTSTIFTCIAPGFSDLIARDIETQATNDYHAHHTTNFINMADENPLLQDLKKKHEGHRDTINADVGLMLGLLGATITPQTAALADAGAADAGAVAGFQITRRFTPFTDSATLEKLQNIIAAALTADADAINDIEDRHAAKKTATSSETAETLLEKALVFDKDRQPGINRLAYFLMFKILPWLNEVYKSDPVEADTILKDQIPTHYPEWIDRTILDKSLEINLLDDQPVNIAKVLFPVPKAASDLGAAKVYKYNGSFSNVFELTQGSYTLTVAKDNQSVTIAGIKEYGAYYISVGNKKYFFKVEQKEKNQFIYDPEGVVNVESKPKGFEKSNVTPKLTLKLGNDIVDEANFQVRLNNNSPWQKLSDFANPNFLKSLQTVHFKGLDAGNYTFEVATPNGMVQRILFGILPKIIHPSGMAVCRLYKKDDISAQPISVDAPIGVRVRRSVFDTADAGERKEVTLYYEYDNSGAYPKRDNFILIPQSSTTADIIAPCKPCVTPKPTPSAPPAEEWHALFDTDDDGSLLNVRFIGADTAPADTTAVTNVQVADASNNNPITVSSNTDIFNTAFSIYLDFNNIAFSGRVNVNFKVGGKAYSLKNVKINYTPTMS